MKKLCMYFLVFSSLTLLSGCKFNFISNLYVPDLRKVASNEHTVIMTPATFEVEIPSKDDCAEFSTKLTELMSDLISDISPKGCVDRGFETYLLMEAEIPIVNGFAKWLESTSMFGILMFENNLGFSISLMNNLDKYKILNNRLSKEYHQTFDISKSTLTIVLNSSLNEEVVLMQDVFVNRKPVDRYLEYPLKRRTRVEIILSNVASSHLESEGSAFAFILKK